MQASVIIPLWNGASVICDCLDAIDAQGGDKPLEVICVDNASQDGSAELVAERYPHVQLIRQPVNLGFAGGVNAGMEVARGDLFILLNQDCVVHSGWLTALMGVLQKHTAFGIAGCTILNRDGTVNHTGAVIRRPDALGVHLGTIEETETRCIEFVTGAAMAIRRQAWGSIGRFDEGYYPAYYEDADYCYRARHKGIEITHVPEARVTHLLASHSWLADPLKHTANHHRARYRFVSKHFDNDEVSSFFEAEYASLETESYLDQAVGRAIAARDTLRTLTDILERRRFDLGDAPSAADRRQLLVGFTGVLRRSFAVAERLSQVGLGESIPVLDSAVDRSPLGGLSTLEEWQDACQQLEALRNRESRLLARIYFRDPSASNAPEPPLRRLLRLLVLRPVSFLIGRDYLLLSELNTVHVARLDQMEYLHQLYQAQIKAQMTRMDRLQEQMGQQQEQMEQRQEQMERRLRLLEALVDYDYC